MRPKKRTHKIIDTPFIGVVWADSEYSADHYLDHRRKLTAAYAFAGYQIFLRPAIQSIVTAPERLWRRILCWLWHDRLTFQYESGFAAGLREGLANAEAYAGLTPEELEAVLSEPTPGDAP